MARTVFIVQGEGKGHLSQAMALHEYLREAGHTVEAVFLGINQSDAVPDYFRDSFPGILQIFRSPSFLRTPNQKGIYVGRTILFNLMRALDYIKTIGRIRREIRTIRPDVIFNFYELLGALAMRKTAAGIRRIGVGHHFYLYLNRSVCSGRPVWHRYLLMLHTRLVIGSCDRVLALSFKPDKGNALIRVIPPLLRREFREMHYVPGERYLVYLLQEGFVYDVLMMARDLHGFRADLFTSLKPAIDIPDGVAIHPFDAVRFRELMASCRGLVSTAGFDTAAEAAFHGIPLAVIPSHNHYEQRCNGDDIAANGIGMVVPQLDGDFLERIGPSDCEEFRAWVNLAGEEIVKCMAE